MRAVVLLVLALLSGCAGSPLTPGHYGLDVLQRDGTLKPYEPESKQPPAWLSGYIKQHVDYRGIDCNLSEKTCTVFTCVKPSKRKLYDKHQGHMVKDGWSVLFYVARCRSS